MQTLFGMTGPLRAVWEHVESAIPVSGQRRQVVLVIDEINRADLSRVFGDIITLLEPDKRLGSVEERQILLPYSQVLFGVPQELHIVGTMNTADRSLSVMDLALRRRFDFVEVAPNPARCAAPYAGIDLPAILQGWNRTISALASREKQIGHAYLERAKLEEVRITGRFGNNPDGELRAVAIAIRQAIMPLLLEIFRGDWYRVDFVFGKDFDNDTGGLLSPVDDSSVRGRAGDQIDIGVVSDHVVPGWWDPAKLEWDPERFRKSLSAAAS